jgi:hypothetical protein
MGSQAERSAEFWLRSILRESVVDGCILNAVLAIGALAHAQDENTSSQPLFQMSLSSSSLSSHYRQAVRYFTKAISELRSRINDASQTRILRTILISTVLFSFFEALQGNTAAVDKLTGQGILLLKEVILNLAASHNGSRVAHLVDDQGVQEAGLFLIRNATWNVMYSPLYPCQEASILQLGCSPIELLPLPDSTYDTEDFNITWWQVVNLAGIWKIGIDRLLMNGITEPTMQKSQHELKRLLSIVQLWEMAAWDRMIEQKDAEVRLILMRLSIGAKALHAMMTCALDLTGAGWDTPENSGLEVVQLCLAPVQMATADTRSIMYDATLAGISKITQTARDKGVRFGAMEAWKRLLNRHSSWDMKSIFMGTSALVDAEEAHRDANGHIPFRARYEWTGGSWNKDHTEFQVTLTSVLKDDEGKQHRKVVLLRPSDFHFW